MRNSPTLPVLSLIVAAVLALVVAATHDTGPLKELELGGVAWVVGLAVFGLQGLISIAVEGEEVHPGLVRSRLTNPLSLSIAVLSIALVVIAGFLGYGLRNDWSHGRLGALAGIGCIAIALIAVVYKEGFVGEEGTFDLRDDGVPW
jgi:hypothetical protein